MTQEIDVLTRLVWRGHLQRLETKSDEPSFFYFRKWMLEDGVEQFYQAMDDRARQRIAAQKGRG